MFTKVVALATEVIWSEVIQNVKWRARKMPESTAGKIVRTLRMEGGEFGFCQEIGSDNQGRDAHPVDGDCKWRRVGELHEDGCERQRSHAEEHESPQHLRPWL